jgi:hypothetical protein
MEGGIAWVCMLVAATWAMCRVLWFVLEDIPPRAWLALLALGAGYLEYRSWFWPYEEWLGMHQLLLIPSVLFGVPALIGWYFRRRTKRGFHT